ncbi:MAG TPA: phage major capsid protein [Ruminococcaceae bacterium]|nr:phage major capsid protein [Oscillospiraceae bacterium]
MANFEKINLEKGMYQAGRSLTEILEEMDPSENYKGTALEGLDAFSRQLKRFDIKVSGKGSDTIEKFFATTDSAALFPEYVSRAVNAGREEADMLSDIVATVTKIDGMDYRSCTSSLSDDDKSLKRVAEGAFIPTTEIKTSDHLVRLHKRGRMLVASYEALRFQRIDLFTVTLKQIGAYIARTQMADAVDVILNGDGNQNGCGSVTPASAGSLSYADLINMWSSLAPFELNTVLAGTPAMTDLLTMSEMKDAVAGLNFQGSGKMITPLGANLIHTTALNGKNMIGLDKNCALEMVVAGDVVVDYDKLIDRQLEKASISCIAGFAKIYNGAAKKLSY